MPVLRLKRDDPEDLTALSANLARLAPIAPNLVEVSVIRDKFGFPEPAKDAICIGRPDNADEVEVIEKVPEKRQRAEARPQAGQDGRDWIDDLVDDSLGNWEPLVTPFRRQLEELAARSASYEEFLAGLARLAGELDAEELKNALASAMFAAFQVAGKGEGDA